MLHIKEVGMVGILLNPEQLNRNRDLTDQPPLGYVMLMTENNFIVKKLPNLPNLDEYYNIRIDSTEFIVDKEHLKQLKSEIELLLQDQ